MNAPLLQIEDLSVAFGAGDGAAPAAAVRTVSLQIQRGESLGLVGESGSGKSVTSLAIMRLLPPSARTTGKIVFDGSDLLALPHESRSGGDMRGVRGAKIAMIFQEPMTALNPVMRVGDQVAEAVLAHHAVSKQEAGRRALAVLQDVALREPEKRARDYPHQLSGGMRQRVMIAMALVNTPQLLIADEPTTALDVTVQAQILELLADLRAKYGLTMLFISHDLAVVSQVTDRVAIMYAGQIIESAPARTIFQKPLHPYTRGLLNAAPTLKTDRQRPLASIEGAVPSAVTLPPGCAFEPRCGMRIAWCRDHHPELEQAADEHWVRCPVTLASPHDQASS